MLILAFSLSLLALILQSILPSQISLLAFSPFLSLTLMRSTLHKALWLAAFCGSLMDLMSNDPIGVHALTYVLVSAILYKIKSHFLSDEPFHLSVYTAIYSFTAGVFQLLLLFLFDRRVPIEGRWALTDFLGMPVIDGLYAFVWVAAPLSLFLKLKKLWNLFWLKKKLSRTSH